MSTDELARIVEITARITGDAQAVRLVRQMV